MAQITLNNVVTEFPIYGAQPSLRSRCSAASEEFCGVAATARGNALSCGRSIMCRLPINHGDQLGILGHNGAGKSTMLRVLAGIYQPSHGSISIEGRVSPLFATSPGLAVTIPVMKIL